MSSIQSPSCLSPDEQYIKQALLQSLNSVDFEVQRAVIKPYQDLLTWNKKSYPILSEAVKLHKNGKGTALQMLSEIVGERVLFRKLDLVNERAVNLFVACEQLDLETAGQLLQRTCFEDKICIQAMRIAFAKESKDLAVAILLNSQTHAYVILSTLFEENPEMPLLKDIIFTSKFDPNRNDGELLIDAAEAKNVPFFEFLLQLDLPVENREIDPRLRRNHLFSYRFCSEITQLLIKEGRADPSSNDMLGVKLCMRAKDEVNALLMLADPRCKALPDKKKEEFLAYAVCSGSLTIVKWISNQKWVIPYTSSLSVWIENAKDNPEMRAILQKMER